MCWDSRWCRAWLVFTFLVLSRWYSGSQLRLQTDGPRDQSYLLPDTFLELWPSESLPPHYLGTQWISKLYPITFYRWIHWPLSCITVHITLYSVHHITNCCYFYRTSPIGDLKIKFAAVRMVWKGGSTSGFKGKRLFQNSLSASFKNNSNGEVVQQH